MPERCLEECIGELQYLFGTENRLNILFSLAERPRPADELQTALDIPRTTLRRTLNELEDRGWITSGAKQVFSLTFGGRILATALDSSVSRVNQLVDLSKVLDQLPQSVHEELFGDVQAETFLRLTDQYSMTVGTPEQPYAPAERVLEVLTEVDRLYGFMPVYNPLYGDLIQRFIERDSEIELLVTPSVANRVSEGVRRGRDTMFGEKSRFFVASELPSYELFLTPNKVLVTAYNDQNLACGLLETSRDCCLFDRWATTAYKSNFEDRKVESIA
ncbi:winged helix-turn-helix domain-containing protein [Haloferax sp. Q22]|uniref:helix-turn-helix transcriptional regulator n=1 Tax=Haloferax sp. (strain Q22) TaxID=1526048 RepID=UPI000ADFE05E|nr:helix-turn-helix domain-containing protein [Haloferax sp. Q22]